MIKFKKIRSSAMQFAILVAAIIAVLLGSFLTLSHTQTFFNNQSKISLNVIDSVNVKIKQFLKKKLPADDTLSTKNGIYRTQIICDNWGGYFKIYGTASAKTTSFSKIALIGGRTLNPALGVYLTETKLPLVLVGDAAIDGDAYISDFGIKAGIIAGHYYSGKELIKGNIKTAETTLPELDPIWLSDLRKLQEYVPLNSGEILLGEGVHKNSFFDNTQFVYEANSLNLYGRYVGNIIIKSETEVVITKNAHLTDVVISAPKITIEKGVRGSASFIAQERITVEEDVHLAYPSSLIVINKQGNNEILSPVSKGEEPIFMANNSSIKGTVVFLTNGTKSQEGFSNTDAQVAIAPMAVITGYVYCQGNVELSGSVKGSVYAHRFIAREHGSIYINHIYNGKIMGRDLDPAFGGLPFKAGEMAIGKWLY